MAGGADTRRRAAERAERFQRVRDAHQMEMAEDYVELIADLIDEKGEARVVDLAGCLGVTKPTVNSAIQRLQRDGLVSSERYRSIFLTEKGRGLALCSRRRHRVVREFRRPRRRHQDRRRRRRGHRASRQRGNAGSLSPPPGQDPPRPEGAARLIPAGPR